MIGSTIGLIHVIFSVIALLTGLYVLLTTKGTPRHKQVGYVYSAAMLGVNLTAFMIYRLYGTFALFHWMAVLSLTILVAGLYPVLTKKLPNYKVWHFSFMYWSVIGLYSALVAEIFSRLPRMVLDESGKPMIIFYQFVGIGSALVMGLGAWFFIKLRPRWEKQFGRTLERLS